MTSEPYDQSDNAPVFRGMLDALRRVKAEYNDRFDDDTPADQARFAIMLNLERQMAAIPPISVAAYAFKVVLADDNGDMNANAEQVALAAEARRIAAAYGRSDSPIIDRFHMNRALLAAAEVYQTVGTGSAEDEELNTLFWDEANRLAFEIEALPSATAADLAAKAVVATAQGDLCPDWETDPFWIEARSLLAA